MADQIMREILERLRKLGSDWPQQLADEMVGEERDRLNEALQGKVGREGANGN